MSRILVLGVGPIAPEKPDRLMAPGLRTWSLAEYLAGHGHEVVLTEALFGGADPAGTQTFARADDVALPHGVELWRVKFHWPEIAAFCRQLHFSVGQASRLSDAENQIDATREDRRDACPTLGRFDAAIATTDLMCRALVEARLTCPIWLDFNGHPMAERQLLAAVHGADDGLRDQWEMVVPCLLAGDRFSTCSAPQRHALLGELALAGRLNEKSAPLDFVHNLPPVTPSLDLTPSGPAVRSARVPQDAFIVLWTGGYNTWTDVGTLFAGLSRAMERAPRLCYVSTGGAITGHDERTFRRFEALVARSPLRERFVLAGWVPLDEVRNYYAEADVAVNIDADTVEARLGHRNRVTEWILAGTPVISTAVSDFTRRLAAGDALTAIPVGDAQALCDALLAHAADRELGRRQNARAREYLRQHHAPDVVYRELLAWVADPQPAPDLPPPAARGPDMPLGPGGLLAGRLAELHAHPPVARRRWGLGLGIKPRIERWLGRLARCMGRSGP